MKLYTFLFCLLISIGEIKSQDVDSYKNYEFQEFLNTKTIDSGYNYIKTIHRKINTDYTYFENRDDINIKVLLINNGDNKGIEIIPIDKTNNFRKDIIQTLTIANEDLIKNDNEKYITELNIIYDYESHIENWNWKKEFPKIRLFLFKYKRKKVIIH